ncbi:CarD family transcriptional regulator [Aquibacillus sediminis]|uniref:CarD family transcriptional regulator n=1 Tax=Aquibacillus sediminis TaxID=2574734 RepID=UPI001107A806|nr:CarD family transcriptional regulator [Aquibacillus sediminis]
MFTIGDLVIYSSHGICKIDDICDKTIFGTTKKYYVLHPMEDDHQLTISTPVNNDKVMMLELIDREEAQQILDSFHHPGVEWNTNHHERFQQYSTIIKTGDRKEIAKVINTLIRKKIEAERNERKFYERESGMLKETKQILFEELAISLDTTFEKINEMVLRSLKEAELV